MEQSTPLSEAQKVALDKLTAAVGPEYVEFLVSQGPDVLNTRIEGFMQYEKFLVGQVQDQMASAMPTCFVSVSDEQARRRPLRWMLSRTLGKRERTSSYGSVISKWPQSLACSRSGISGSLWR